MGLHRIPTRRWPSIGEYEARNPIMAKYLDKVKGCKSIFEYFNISHILRGENAHADILSRLTTSVDNALSRACIKYLDTPSIDKVEEIQ